MRTILMHDLWKIANERVIGERLWLAIFQHKCIIKIVQANQAWSYLFILYVQRWEINIWHWQWQPLEQPGSEIFEPQNGFLTICFLLIFLKYWVNVFLLFSLWRFSFEDSLFIVKIYHKYSFLASSKEAPCISLGRKTVWSIKMPVR